MVKESKIKDLVYGKVADMLIDHLSNFGFKYTKSKHQFIRQQGDIHYIIYLSYPFAPLVYDEEKNKLLLSFTVTSAVEMPKFDKWYAEKTNDTTRFSYRKDFLNSAIEISMEDFAREDFYTPTASQEFKRNITRTLINKEDEHFIPFDNFISQGLLNLATGIADLSDVEKIFNADPTRKFYLQYISLLLFGGYTEKANNSFDQVFQKYVEVIEEKQKTNAEEAISSIRNLDGFIATAQKVAQRSYTNPFKRSIKVVNSQGEKFDFSSNIQFHESVRLNTSDFDIRALHVNSIGEILLYTGDFRILKLSARGELLFEKEIAPPVGFARWLNVQTGLIKETDVFFVNNYIIDKNNTIIELPLPVKKQTGKKLQDPHIIDVAWSQKNNQYLVLYQNEFITYNKTGKVEKSIPVSWSTSNRIIVEKEWIVNQTGDNAHQVLDYEGQTLARYEFANGNDHYEFSNSFEHFICFFYATKSQYFNLVNGKKESLWAHPTFIKDYKETLYNDIHHNFGLTLARFSPDDQYIIGGAYHGKYVAWTLPKLERIELIPKPEVFDQLKQMTGNLPEIFVLEKHTFLKNRGNDISNIIFFDNGNLFLTQLGAYLLLLWDRTFNNLGYYKTNGKIALHCEKFLTQQSKNEIVVYVKSQANVTHQVSTNG
jgi:hypothetical protein